MNIYTIEKGIVDPSTGYFSWICDLRVDQTWEAAYFTAQKLNRFAHLMGASARYQAVKQREFGPQSLMGRRVALAA